MSKSIVISLIGAALGGWLGYHAFYWIMKHGFYAMVVPGALIGLGASFGGGRQVAVSIVCGLMALALGFFLEWQIKPFIADGSWTYFVTHLHQIKPVPWVMIILGALFAFWIPYRRKAGS